MPKIIRYNGNLQAFASGAPGTERTIFGEVTQSNDLTAQVTADFLRGWGIVGPSDQPTLQDFNAAMYTHGQLLAYLHQMGIAEYSAGQEYQVDSAVLRLGKIYLSRTANNIGNAPESSPANWSNQGLGRLLAIRVFRTNTVYTPTAGTASVVVEVQGGGGAGGGAPVSTAGLASAGSGGNAGAYAKSVVLSGFSGVNITVGAVGIGVVGVNGGNGGSSSFGSIVSAPGGEGGIAYAPFAPPFININQSGQTIPTGGTLVSAAGGRGSPGVVTTVNYGGAGDGGFSLFGAGGQSAPVLNNTFRHGFASICDGAGGGGGMTSGNSVSAAMGGNGGNGVVIVWEYA